MFKLRVSKTLCRSSVAFLDAGPGMSVLRAGPEGSPANRLGAAAMRGAERQNALRAVGVRAARAAGRARDAEALRRAIVSGV